jgi:hypothetical protein
MNGQELHQLIINKWGCSFDVQIRKVQQKIYLQIMWRYQEQVSFPLSQLEYLDHLNDLSTYLNDWGVVEQVRDFIQETKEKPRLGKAVSLLLDLNGRSIEWLM